MIVLLNCKVRVVQYVITTKEHYPSYRVGIADFTIYVDRCYVVPQRLRTFESWNLYAWLLKFVDVYSIACCEE